MADLSKTLLYDLCLQITGEFEGHGYSTCTNNFDGNGASFGILQWNLGKGTFQDHILSQVDVTRYDFPQSIRPLQTLDSASCVLWAKDMFYDVRGKWKPEWKESFENFLTSPLLISLQKRACDSYYHQAKCISGKMGFMQDNKRAMAWSFDLAVQSWNLKIDRPNLNDEQCDSIIQLYEPKNYLIWDRQQINNDQKILLIASHLRALKCKPEWRLNFFNRKATIAIGIGIVNGKLFDLNDLLR